MDKETNEILAWIDEINFSRSKKNLNKDFSDGVFIAELIKAHIPSIVDLHNYIPTSNTEQKRSNWLVLNKKVFPKIDLKLTNNEIENLIKGQNNYIEALLRQLYGLLKDHKQSNSSLSSKNVNTSDSPKRKRSPNKHDYTHLEPDSIEIRKKVKSIEELDAKVIEKERQINTIKKILFSLEDDYKFYKDRLYNAIKDRDSYFDNSISGVANKQSNQSNHNDQISRSKEKNK